MTCYGALQEAATYLIYEAQKKKAREEGDELLEQIFFYISRDEAAHQGFYKKVLIYELEDDREGTLADLAHVVFNFVMPGVALIPEYERRLAVDGVGITPQHFLNRGIFPLLKSVGTSRQELIRIYSQQKQATRAATPQETPLAAAG